VLLLCWFDRCHPLLLLLQQQDGQQGMAPTHNTGRNSIQGMDLHLLLKPLLLLLRVRLLPFGASADRSRLLEADPPLLLLPLLLTVRQGLAPTAALAPVAAAPGWGLLHHDGPLHT
jgi:hypothetical protein